MSSTVKGPRWPAEWRDGVRSCAGYNRHCGWRTPSYGARSKLLDACGYGSGRAHAASRATAARLRPAFGCRVWHRSVSCSASGGAGRQPLPSAKRPPANNRLAIRVTQQMRARVGKPGACIGLADRLADEIGTGGLVAWRDVADEDGPIGGLGTFLLKVGGDGFTGGGGQWRRPRGGPWCGAGRVCRFANQCRPGSAGRSRRCAVRGRAHSARWRSARRIELPGWPSDPISRSTSSTVSVLGSEADQLAG